MLRQRALARRARYPMALLVAHTQRIDYFAGLRGDDYFPPWFKEVLQAFPRVA
jgi:hypothetical protein